MWGVLMVCSPLTLALSLALLAWLMWEPVEDWCGCVSRTLAGVFMVFAVAFAIVAVWNLGVG